MIDPLKFILAWIVYPALLALFCTIILFSGYVVIAGIKLAFDKLFCIVCERLRHIGGGATSTSVQEGQHPPLSPLSPSSVDVQTDKEAEGAVMVNIPAPEKYKRERNLSMASCAICLEDLMDGELCQTLPECQHTFHSSCINPWLIKTQNCPVCRQSLPDV